MIAGATASTPTREESERLLALGTVDAGRVYEGHILAALLRIEALLTARAEVAAPSADNRPPTKRGKR